VALTGSLLGGLAGTVLPIVAMTTYNDKGPADGLPPIPIVVPGSLVILLLALPVAAAVVAALVVRARPVAPVADLALLDG
jgi:hypothetical protein